MALRLSAVLMHRVVLVLRPHVELTLNRVYLGYHTPGQAAAGGALGLALGALSAAAVERAGAAGWLRRLERSALGEALLLKDSEGAPPRTRARRHP